MTAAESDSGADHGVVHPDTDPGEAGEIDFDRVHILILNATQADELRAQEGDPEITCPCGATGSLRSAFRCFYCGVVFCPACAEDHFEDAYANPPAQQATLGEVGHD